MTPDQMDEAIRLIALTISKPDTRLACLLVDSETGQVWAKSLPRDSVPPMADLLATMVAERAKLILGGE